MGNESLCTLKTQLITYPKDTVMIHPVSYCDPEDEWSSFPGNTEGKARWMEQELLNLD